MNFAQVLAMVRHMMQAAGVYVVSTGNLEVSQYETLAGAILTIIPIVWSIIEKRNKPQ